jgi:hypothetical protein
MRSTPTPRISLLFNAAGAWLASFKSKSVYMYIGLNWDVGSHFQKFPGVLPGAVGHTAYDPFMVEQRVIKLRNGAHGDSGQRQRAAAWETRNAYGGQEKPAVVRLSAST